MENREGIIIEEETTTEINDKIILDDNGNGTKTIMYNVKNTNDHPVSMPSLIQNIKAVTQDLKLSYVTSKSTAIASNGTNGGFSQLEFQLTGLVIIIDTVAIFTHSVRSK